MVDNCPFVHAASNLLLLIPGVYIKLNPDAVYPHDLCFYADFASQWSCRQVLDIHMRADAGITLR